MKVWVNLCIVADLPKMGGTSTSVLLFVSAEPVADTLKKNVDDPQSSMEIGTLKVEPVSLHNIIYYTLLNT